MKNPPKVTIIIPVYGDWPSLSECIESLQQYVDQRNNVMLVNDCGPEADMIEQHIQEAIVGYSNFSYYRNEKNLGFVQNCNRAVLELDKTNNDILLLNSDTKVTAGFLEQMLDVLYQDEIGAVSPRSNNATIATIPLSAAAQKGIEANKSYALFKKLSTKLPPYTIVPTAHGFCMLLRRTLINTYGLFDPVFGKGYGEEVDFCQRILVHGYKSALCNHAFVFHQEARSFSLEVKSKLLEEHNKIIWERYPTYRQAVRDYMTEAVVREEAVYPTVKSSLKRMLKRSKPIRKLAASLRRPGK